MIRSYQKHDLDRMLDIWLAASIQAHHFIAEEFWQAQVINMRELYLPASENYVFEQDGSVVGFYSLHDDMLAAIFVSPELQGRGIGKQLLDHAKAQRKRISLSVYKENQPAYQFYLSQGFKVVSEQPDQHTGHPEYTMVFEQN